MKFVWQISYPPKNGVCLGVPKICLQSKTWPYLIQWTQIGNAKDGNLQISLRKRRLKHLFAGLNKQNIIFAKDALQNLQLIDSTLLVLRWTSSKFVIGRQIFETVYLWVGAFIFQLNLLPPYLLCSQGIIPIFFYVFPVQLNG